MRLLPSGTTALLVEVDDLEQVLALHAALAAHPPAGVVDIVPAGRTVLLTTAAGTHLPAVAEAVRRTTPVSRGRRRGDVVELPVSYDGADLPDVADLMGCTVQEAVRRHVQETWTVAFCGFAPGFGYLTGGDPALRVPRRADPRTRVAAGSVALADEFTGVYPREMPGGWQLIGRTDLVLFDVDRQPPALLAPGTRVRFVERAPCSR